MLIGRRELMRAGGLGCLVLPGFGALRAADAAPRRHSAGSGASRPGARRLVVIDAGHGGRDPGTIGGRGTLEKDVALATALALRHVLERSGRCRVAMTRAGDEFIPLAGRVAFARERRADLFVSLHANASPDRQVRGASVYTLAFKASDRGSAALARRENDADRLAGPAVRNAPPALAHILAGLARRATRTGSARLQRSIVRHFRHHVPMLPDPARHARFAVLKAPDIPSVLVEIGFLSNRHEEAELARPAYRSHLAAALDSAITAYLARVGSVGLLAG